MSDISDGLIEIHDSDVDVDEIMTQIRDRIEQRRKEMGYPRKSFPVFGSAAFPGEPVNGDFDVDLYYHLRKANELYADFDLTPVLASSPATRLPVIGNLWNRIRRGAHNLVLFYLARFVRQEVKLNRHLVSTLNRMAVVQQEQRELVSELRERCNLEVPRLDAGA